MKEFSKINYHYFFFIILFIIQIIIFKDYGFPNDEEISRFNGLVSYNYIIDKFNLSILQVYPDIPKLENYTELHDWLVAIGFPKSRTQFESFRSRNTNSFPTQTPKSTGSAKTNDNAVGVQSMYSDASLIITSSKNNPTVDVRFSDIYPVALSALQFDQQAGDVTYLTATCTFSYTLYEIFTL